MDLAESAVAYDGLPISSGGAHGLGRRAPRAAVDAWTRFLEVTRAEPVSGFFDVNDLPGLTADPGLVAAIGETYAASAQVRDRFDVPVGRIDEAVGLLESFGDLAANEHGRTAVSLWLTTTLEVLGPEGVPWPGQDPARYGHFVTPRGVLLGASSSKLILSRKHSVGLTLSVPDASDDDLAVLLPPLAAAFPARLSPRQWTRWTRTRNGRSYRGARISPPGLVA